MTALLNKKIILGVSGSIAAYKTPQLVRMLKKQGAEVRVVCTPAAKSFVSELSLSTVSQSPVLSDVSTESNWNNHVELGRWADCMLIAPCSANTLAKLAHGLCDNLLTAVYLSAVCPVIIAPAMDEDMWHHPSVKYNLSQVQSFGNAIIPVGYGELASGLVGDGRLAELEDIVTYLEHLFTPKALPLSGKHYLITAGPTFERIDPVRFIGNFSTGKMGIALAESLSAQGAAVTLVLGPTHLRPKSDNIKVLAVESADEMYEACVSIFGQMDGAIMSAAVADFKSANKAIHKIKKQDAALEIQLVPNKDILAYLGSVKKADQTLVGFALETQNEVANAQKKLMSKNADYVVLNSLNDEGAGFGSDTNKVSILSKDGVLDALPLMSKDAVAKAIIEKIFLT